MHQKYHAKHRAKQLEIAKLFVTENKTRPDIRPQVVNLSLRSLVVMDSWTDRRTHRQTDKVVYRVADSQLKRGIWMRGALESYYMWLHAMPPPLPPCPLHTYQDALLFVPILFE